MKRHEGLIPLSHDHHQGLVHASRLKKAAGGERPLVETVDAFLAFYPDDLVRHFREEEETLGVILAQKAGADDPQRVRLFTEHQTFHMRVRDLSTARDAEEGLAEIAAELGGMLEQHIRWEERELFPRIEGLLTEEELLALPAHYGGGNYYVPETPSKAAP